jgi:hypothetical protein
MDHLRPDQITHLAIVMRVTESQLHRLTTNEFYEANLYFFRVRACAAPSMKYLDSKPFSGVPMPRYLSQHTLACLTRQGAETLAQRMQGGGPACAERVLVNMVEGKMFAEFRSDSRETLEAWLKTEGMHFDWLVRIEWETRDGKLQLAE